MFPLGRSHRRNKSPHPTSLPPTNPLNPPSPLTYRYLEIQLPCLGGCDVTGGISNVIPVSRRDLARECLMADEALSSARAAQPLPGRPRWKGLFKALLLSTRARWEPPGRGPIRWRLPYPYKCAQLCQHLHTHTQSSHPVVRTLFSSPRLDLIPFLFSHSSGSQQSTALLFILPDIHAIWQVIPATSHSHTISQTSPPVTSAAPRYDWAGFHRLLSFI